MQVIEVGLRSGSTTTKAWALCDTRRSHSWVSKDAKTSLGRHGSSDTVSVRGVTRSLEGETSCDSLELHSLKDFSLKPLKFLDLVRHHLSLGDDGNYANQK